MSGDRSARRAVATALLAAAVPLSPLAAPAAHGPPASVPERFVGHWAGSPEACGSDTDDLILRIAPGHITYWESDGPIRAVVARAADEIALIAELSGEGETWLSPVRFRLSADGRRLIDETSIPGNEVVRYRCPQVAGAASAHGSGRSPR